MQAAAGTRASVLFAVPTIYQALADSPAALAGGLRGLRLAVCGSAPLSPSLAARLPAVLGRLPLVRYGTTESGLNVSNPVADPRGDTLGVPLPGVLVRIRAADGVADPGADGEIQLRGPHVFSGYWHDQAATGAAFTPDGWFRTGDIGAVDPATGHLVIRGRTKEMIISGGLNVYPREVEIALEGHPSVAEAAVAGVPDERWGERVTAWVVRGTGTGSTRPRSSRTPGRCWPGTSAPSGCSGWRSCPATSSARSSAARCAESRSGWPEPRSGWREPRSGSPDPRSGRAGCSDCHGPGEGGTVRMVSEVRLVHTLARVTQPICAAPARKTAVPPRKPLAPARKTPRQPETRCEAWYKNGLSTL